jgi:hypothetical protein
VCAVAIGVFTRLSCCGDGNTKIVKSEAPKSAKKGKKGAEVSHVYIYMLIYM